MTVRLVAAAALLLLGGAAPAPELAYKVAEGRNLNAFVRDGPVAAHLLLRSGRDPRILVAFPAGNSGVALWFAPLAAPATWRLDQAPLPTTVVDARGRPLYGIRAVATIDAPRLEVKQAVLSSVRIIRDYQALGTIPAAVAVAATSSGATLDYARDRADGAPGYRLSLAVVDGRLDGTTITAGTDGHIRLALTAASGDVPLIPLGGTALLNARAADDPAARNTLTFLSYREKFLAGSWRFNTYFGRDTLMSLRLLLPALQPDAVEAGLGAVLARLAPDGEAAHEEGLSEFAVLEHRRLGDRLGDAPTLDYGMVDTSLMLAPVAAAYLLDRPDGRARAGGFLTTRFGDASAAALMVRNARFVVAAGRAFARDPVAANLVPIKPHRLTGQWRDSEEGLGRGRFAYDINAVWLPAALAAIARMTAAGLFDSVLTPADRAALAPAAAMADVWRVKAPPLFAVTSGNREARREIVSYAARAGVPAAPALTALGDADLTYHALSLDADGRPVPILNSDEGFALLFTDPAPADLDRAVAAVMRPFPAGLMTDVGLLVANPVLADPVVQARFSRNAYHGTVVWSWQQALFAAGLERQLRRPDLPPAIRARLVAAQATLWQAIEATRSFGDSELWSWAFADGRYTVAPFGASGADVDESNAAQLWSTVYLAVRPPGPRKAPTVSRPTSGSADSTAPVGISPQWSSALR